MTAAMLVSLSLLLTTMGSAVAVDGTDRSELEAGASVSGIEQAGEPIHAPKSASGQMAQTDPALLGRNDTTPVSVLIKLDFDAVASYAGGVEGLAATSPEVTGVPLAQNEAAVDAYVRHLDDRDAAARAAIEAAVPQSTVLNSFHVAYGGVSAVVPANRIGALLEVDGVVAVQQDSLEQLQTDATPDFIGATEAWDEISDSTTAGEGVIVGVIDSGIWPEHPSLVDNGIDHPGGTFACEFGDGTDPQIGDAFACNDKLIGAYAFTDTYMALKDAIPGEFCNNTTGECSARDANGHGTHTATTAAGSHVEVAELLGVDRGPISGIAPGAHVIAYRVCLAEGCFPSDSIAAVQQAILDGVDVINFSISGGADAYTDPVELAFLDAYAAGILVNTSAGNSGPGAGTADHAGPWTNTVGASTSDRHFLTHVNLTSTGGPLDLVGATVTDGVSPPADVILAEDVPGYDDPLCQTDLPAASAPGLIVACERGVIARVDKSRHVEPSGAAGMILYNLDPANGTGLNTDNHFIPTVHIDVADGEALLDYLDANADAQASWDGGTATPVPGDVMAGFSSRGPLGDFLKPDVTAPGVQILAGNTPEPAGEGTGLPGELYQAIQGTSMASPHAAGVSALVKAAHPTWTPGQIKSALMTSSLQAVVKEDGSTPADPFDRGAGSIRADRAISPTVTFDVDAADYTASAADPMGRLRLNLPSVFADPMPGALSTSRTLKNVSGTAQTIDVSASGPSGSITVTPSNLTVAAEATAEIEISIDGTGLADGWHFGQIALDVVGSGTDAVLPVAFNKTEASVTLDHSCAPSTIFKGAASSCTVTATNFASATAEVDLEVGTTASATNQLEITDVGAPGVKSGNGFTWTGTLAPAIAPMIEDLVSDPGGYLSLAAEGVKAVEDVGDETMVNFSVTPFKYGGEVYSTIGVVSNGYAVVGGGEMEDIVATPQDVPDPARPNNVLAPYWTDLNPADGGEIYVAQGTVGSQHYVIIEWEDVPTFSSAGSVTNTFQIWIPTGATEEISFAYDVIEGADPAAGLTIGAENRDGSSAATESAPPATPGNDWYVRTSPPEGGSQTIAYKALGKGVGTFEIDASLTADVMDGTASDSVSVKLNAAAPPEPEPVPFTDIGGSIFKGDIAWLYRNEITGGCSVDPPLFCPNANVTRGQMASFLSRAMNLSATSVDFFDDDDGTTHEGPINRLAAAGITGGCGPRVFCPNDVVPREQMASFLARALKLPTTTVDHFGDDDASQHEADINRVAQADVTRGCGPDRFCPSSVVTRGQMAAFLHRAFKDLF